MDLTTFLSGLSHAEKLEAMEILWQQISQKPSELPSPEWHGKIIAERLANPSPKPNKTIDESMAIIRERLHARRAKG